jgi:hypothetical protein
VPFDSYSSSEVCRHRWRVQCDGGCEQLRQGERVHALHHCPIFISNCFLNIFSLWLMQKIVLCRLYGTTQLLLDVPSQCALAAPASGCACMKATPKVSSLFPDSWSQHLSIFLVYSILQSLFCFSRQLFDDFAASQKSNRNRVRRYFSQAHRRVPTCSSHTKHL